MGGAYWFDDDGDDAASLVVTIGTGLEVLSAFGSQFMKGVFEGSRNVVEVIFKEPSKVRLYRIHNINNYIFIYIYIYIYISSLLHLQA